MISRLFGLNAEDTLEFIKEALQMIDNACLKMVEVFAQDPSTMGSMWTIVQNALEVSTQIALYLCTLYWLVSFIQEIVDRDWRQLSIFWYFKQIIKIIVAQALIHLAPDLFSTIFKFVSWCMNEYAIANNTNAIFSNLDWSGMEQFLNESGFMEHLMTRIQMLIPAIGIWLCSAYCYLLAYGRILQVCLYTIISPISMATYVNGRHSGVFPCLADYVSVVAQSIIVLLGTQLFKGLAMQMVNQEINGFKNVWMLLVACVVFITTIHKAQQLARTFLGGR